MNIIVPVLLRQPLLCDEKQQRKKRRQGERFGIMTPCESASNRRNRETPRKIFQFFLTTDSRARQPKNESKKCGRNVAFSPRIGHFGRESATVGKKDREPEFELRFPEFRQKNGRDREI